MGLRSRIANGFSNFVYRQLEKRGIIEDIFGRVAHYGGYFANDEDILQSSDVYELMQDISNQIVLAEWTVVDDDGKEYKNHRALKTLKNPNHYLTGSEFMKLLTNTYLLEGNVFPVLDRDKLHIATNIQVELTDRLVPKYTANGETVPNSMIRHIKNMGTSWLEGVGLKDLGMNTLEGVMNAEKVLTGKYKKGGLLAFLLKLDAHINPQNGAQKKLIKAILDQLEGIDESRTVKLIPLGKGYEIDTMESPVDDEKILAFLNVYKKDLGKFMGINVDTYQSLLKEDIEKAMMYLHNKVVRPFLKNLEEHLTLLFFGTNSKLKLKSKINILDFVPYSTKTNIAYNLVRTSIAQPDDGREILGLNRMNTEESTMLYISKDLVSLKDLKNATDDSLDDGKEKGKPKEGDE